MSCKATVNSTFLLCAHATRKSPQARGLRRCKAAGLAAIGTDRGINGCQSKRYDTTDAVPTKISEQIKNGSATLPDLQVAMNAISNKTRLKA